MNLNKMFFYEIGLEVPETPYKLRLLIESGKFTEEQLKILRRYNYD